MVVRPAFSMIMAVVLIVVVLDQLTKRIVIEHFVPGQILPVIPGAFNLTLLFNRGAAFGLMANFSDGIRMLALGLTTALALLCVGYFLFREYFEDKVGQVALAMILGGAFGNLIDRLLIGEVVDFLDFYYSVWHWPAFNLADSAICAGVFVLLVRHPRRKSTAEMEKSSSA